MRLLKPAWVSHDGKPIFSIDIHPDGSRFATGGQGEDSGKVVIWNMAPVKNAEDEMNENVPKLLCQMDNHLACVNCVRWSYGGKYLASGGDDKLIMIWQTGRYSVPSTIFGSGGSKMNIEQWRCVHTLRGHSGDVLDLAWSPDDLYIASGSVDNTILIWNALRFPEIIKVVKGHSGLVKGVTWDPVGKFLASQSDDKSLKIWRTADWQLQAEVTEPFQDCGGTTHVLRLSWSPDGHYVVSAHAMNNSGPVAKIVERDGWKTRMDFVGHRKAVTVVRFNPVLFVKKVNGESTKLKQYSCCAIGSRDRALSVWLTSLKRPLVVTHDLFKHSIMDLSWSCSGFELLVCSWDGTVAYADFTPEELGKAMSQEEKERFHKQVYGVSISSSKCTIASSLIENPEMLKIQQRHTMKQQTLANLQKPSAPPPPLVPSANRENSVTSPQLTLGSGSGVFSSPRSGSCSGLSPGKSVREQQVETRTKDGRRRITPLLLTHQLDFSDAPVPFGSSSSQSSFTSPPKPPQPSPSKPTVPLTSISTTSQTMSALDSRIGKNATTGFSPKTKEHKTKDDKGNDKEKGKSSDKPQKEKTCEKTPTKATSMTTSVITAPLGAVSTTATSIPVKRKAETTNTTSKRARKDAHTSSSKSQTSALSSSSKQQTEKADHEENADKTAATRHSITIPYPAPTNRLTVQIGGAESESGMTLDLENNLHSAGLGTHALKCSSGGKVIWESLVTSAGIALAGNRQVVCVACENKSVYIFSPNGRRLIPALALDSSASILQCSGHFVMLVTSSGGVYVWDAKKVRAVVTNQSVLPILTGQDVTINRASITDDGYPVISLSTQAAYTFNASLGAWVQVAWTDDPLAANADYRSTVSSPDPFQVKGPLASLQGQCSRMGRQAARLFRHNPGRQQTATVSHLENQVSACVTLGSGKEYHFWLMTYVRYLVQAGLETRLRELCEELLVPTHSRLSSGDKPSSQDRFILGFSKRDLLREILPIVGSNIRLQRLFTEFKDQLGTER